MHRLLYLGLFVIVNFWTIFVRFSLSSFNLFQPLRLQIHDSDMVTGHPLEKFINGPAHHTLHHIHFNVNYGQYFTWVDRVGNSYRQPDSTLDPLLEVQKADAKKVKRD